MSSVREELLKQKTLALAAAYQERVVSVRVLLKRRDVVRSVGQASLEQRYAGIEQACQEKLYFHPSSL